MKRIGIVVVMILVLALTGAIFAGCGSDDGAVPPATPAPEPISEDTQGIDEGMWITDMTGREVHLAAPATRVVALTAADVEILYAIGAGDTLVGRGEYCNYPPEALDVQSVQSGFETNVEQIIALQPELVLMSTMAQTMEQSQQLENAGIVTFVLDAQTIAETYTAIDLIGKLMGREDEASGLITDMKSVFADLEDKAGAASEDSMKAIYFEVSPLEFGLWTAGTGTFMNEVAELLDLKNIFGDIESWAEISEEQVLERDPDYIMTVGMYFGEGPTPVESILSRPGWESITAIKNEAILNLTEDELSRPGPRLADGARILYEFVYEGITP